MLFDKNDVFADIVNVLVFGGKDKVDPQSLKSTGQKSQLKVSGIIHEQERDVSKLWVAGNTRICLLGLENQTKIEKDMIMRTISYDGATYKEQVIHNRLKNVQKWKPYAAMTLVLYFGKGHWTAPKSMKKLIGYIPPEVDRFVNDYFLHVVEVAYLKPETIALFKSDFKIVADYFVQSRKNKNYIPSPETIIHVEETLKLLSTLTGDNRFEENAKRVISKGGKVTMCDVLNQVELKGRTEAVAEERVKTICAFADLATVHEIAERLKISEDEVRTVLRNAGITPKSE